MKRSKTVPLKAFAFSLLWTTIVIGVPALIGVFSRQEVMVFGALLICFSVAELLVDFWLQTAPESSRGRVVHLRWGISIATITLILVAVAIFR